MKKKLVFCFAILIGGFACSSLAAQAVSPDLWNWGYQFGQDLVLDALRDAYRIPYRISNETGKSIQEVYISRSDSDSWGQNQWTSQDLFLSGYNVDAKSDDVGPYDIMLVATDGWSYIKSHVRITNDTVIKFTASDINKKMF